MLLFYFYCCSIAALGSNKVCNSRWAPTVGITDRNVIGSRKFCTTMGFLTCRARSSNCGADYTDNPRFHPLFVTPPNFGWKETRSARVLTIRIQNILRPVYGHVLPFNLRFGMLPDALRTHGMPILSQPNEFAGWLAGRAGTELLKPAANGYLQMWPVSRRVNSSHAPSNNPTLIDRFLFNCRR